MMKRMWRGRLMTLGLSCMALVTATGCTGLSDQQLSTILQSVVTTGLSAFVSALVTFATGTTVTT